jgi:AcrR family transcriptional regulator
VSPRGVRIPNIRAQLFDAADRVLDRDGPAGLSNRAITTEAGVANGILHRHFADLDQFLAAYVADRLRLIVEGAAALPGRAGQATLVGNLTDAALAVFGPRAQAVMTLVSARPAIAASMNHGPEDGFGGLDAVEGAFSRYLEAEQALGRISKDADTATLAFSLLGVIHHLVVTYPAGVPDLADRVGRITIALVNGMGPPTTPARRG